MQRRVVAVNLAAETHVDVRSSMSNEGVARLGSSPRRRCDVERRKVAAPHRETFVW